MGQISNLRIVFILGRREYNLKRSVMSRDPPCHDPQPHGEFSKALNMYLSKYTMKIENIFHSNWSHRTPHNSLTCHIFECLNKEGVGP
jgi:hypothetical protein